jgi:hypothetical protein
MISAIANKITAFILVFILFAHNINTLTIIGDFIMNQDFIAKTLCIQKDNQQGCNGKCQLMKELKKNAPESNTEIPVQETKRLSLDAFCTFKVNGLDTLIIVHREFHIAFNSSSQNLLHTYFDIDTPPPIFS